RVHGGAFDAGAADVDAECVHGPSVAGSGVQQRSRVISRPGAELVRGRMRRMRWFKIAAIGVGILIAFLVVGSVIGAILHAVIDVVIAAAVVGAIVVAVKVARSRNQVSAQKA